MIGKILKIGAISVVALLIITAIIIKVIFSGDKIKSIVIPIIETEIGRSIEIKSAKATIFPYLGFEINGLTVSNTPRDGFISDPFISLKKFRVKVAFKPLLKKRVEIAEIRIVEPDILVEVDKNGNANYDDLPFMDKDTTIKKKEVEKESKPLNIPISMEKFSIENARIRYFNRKSKQQITLGLINESSSFNADKSLENISTTGKLSINNISIKTKDVPADLKDFSITFNHDININLKDQVATVNEITASLQKIAITVKGKVTDLDKDPILDLSMVTDKIQLTSIINEIPRSLSPEVAKIRAKGWLKVALKAQGKSSSPKIKGKMKIADGEIHYSPLPKAINNINADMEFTSNSLDIEQFRMNFGENPISLIMKVKDFTSPYIDGALKVSLKLDDIREMVSLPEGYAIAGFIKTDITAKGHVNPSKPTDLDVKGNMKIEGLSAKSPSITKPIFIDGSMVMSAKRIVQDMAIRIGDSDLKVKSSLEDYLGLILVDSTIKKPKTSYTLDINSNLLNTNSFLKKADKTDKSDKEVVVANNKPAPILTAPLPPIDIKISANINHLLYDKIDMQNFRGTVTSLNDIFTVAATSNIYGGKMKTGLKLDTKNLKNIDMGYTFNVINVKADKLVSTFNDELKGNRKLSLSIKKLDGGINGGLSFESGFKSHGETDEDFTRNLKGNIFANIINGKLKSGSISKAIGGTINKFIQFDDIEFRTLQFRSKIENESLIIESLDFSSPKLGDWRLYGPIGFNGKLDMKAETRFTKKVSAPLVSASNTGAGAAKGAIDKYIGGSIGGIANKAVSSKLIPSDSEGRVTLLLGILGDIAQPKVKIRGFKKGVANPNSSNTTAKQDLKKLASKEVKAAQKAVKAEIKKTTVKVKKEIKKQTEKVEKEVTKAVGKAPTKKLKKEAASAAKSAKSKLKKFGF